MGTPEARTNDMTEALALLRRFADAYRSGAQGCDMDFEAAQAVALAIDTALAERPTARYEAEEASAERFIASFRPKTPRDAMALTLFRAWVKADPRSIVSEYPASYLANFVDMADAALAAAPPASA